MKRMTKVLLAVAMVGAVATLAHAWNNTHGHGPQMMRKHVLGRIDDALDAAKATPAQKDVVHAAVDNVFQTIASTHQQRSIDMQQAIELFKADRIDASVVAQHRAAHEAELKQIGDAMVQALYDTHDALTSTQRQAVVAWARAQKVEHASDHGFRDKFFQSMIQARIDDALDTIKATPEQRAKVNEVKDQLIASFRNNAADHGAALEQALDLFAADKIDASKVQALRSAQEARFRAVGDAIVQAVTTVHDTLSAEQRQALVAYLQAHHPHHG